MSLIHQVLRDIDQRESTQQSIPAALQLPESSRKRPMVIGVLLLMMAAVLVVGWSSVRDDQVFVETDTIASQARSSESEPLMAESHELKTPLVVKAGSDVLMPERSFQDSIEPKQDVARIDVINIKDDKDTKDAQDVPVSITEAAVIETTSDHQQVVVVRHQQPSREWYLRALNDAQQEQWSVALQHIEQALQHEQATEYLTLKLRILLEQKNKDGFLNWYQRHQRVQSPDWWAVAAPGLHMHGYYDEAILLYQRLQRAQPTIVNWPLAQVLALKQAQRGAEAEPILRTLSQRYALTNTQQRWVQQQLQELTR